MAIKRIPEFLLHCRMGADDVENQGNIFVR